MLAVLYTSLWLMWLLLSHLFVSLSIYASYVWDWLRSRLRLALTLAVSCVSCLWFFYYVKPALTMFLTWAAPYAESWLTGDRGMCVSISFLILVEPIRNEHYFSWIHYQLAGAHREEWGMRMLLFSPNICCYDGACTHFKLSERAN